MQVPSVLLLGDPARTQWRRDTVTGARPVVQVAEITLLMSLGLSTSSFKDGGPCGDLLITVEY